MINITSSNFAKTLFNYDNGPILTLNQYCYMTGLVVLVITLIVQLNTSEPTQRKEERNY